MTETTDLPKPKVSYYRKQNSFETTFSKLKATPEAELKRTLTLLEAALKSGTADEPRKSAWTQVIQALQGGSEGGALSSLKISKFIADEVSLLEDREVPEFWFHRYRYEAYPVLKKLDEFPPYLQIEPSSICNYRCVFCYQTDASFSSRASGMMGKMSLDTFKRIVDEAQGKVQFLSLASRGEPTLCQDLGKMLEYAEGKFLNLKLNTNASMLTEALCHAILSGGARTVVFSADAAEEPTYSQLRVRGSLEKVLANISLFERIRKKDYSQKPLITRVSGVKVNDSQDLDQMISRWGELVDQVAFVAYNPWENIYGTDPNGQQTPCSDLWRRMFVWYDGSVNPCDSDFKSSLKIGNLMNHSLAQLWRSERYEMLRDGHLSGSRQVIEPCRRCALV